MNRRSLLTWFIAGTLLVLAIPPRTISSVFADSAGKQLPGTVPEVVAQRTAQKLNHESPDTVVPFAVTLAARDPSGLQQFLHDLANPSSPAYRHPLTQDDANQRFNPTAAQEQQVVGWLQAHGITVTRTYPNHLLVDAQATVARIESALHVTLNQYQATVRGKLRTFRAPDRDPSVDATVGGVVSGIVGLDTYPRFFTPHTNGTAHGQPAYYPQDFANAYDVNPLWNAGYTGGGQHIGITLWMVPPSDSTLQSWGSTTGAAAPTTANGRLKVIPIDGGTTTADSGEAGLDIEMAGGMAPGATLDYYESPTDSSGNPTDQGLIDALNIAGTDSNQNGVISSSWGGCEASSATDSFTSSAETIFAANTATGHNYVFSAGDDGSSCNPNSAFSWVNPWPDYPASSPNVTTVGGTSFSAKVGSAYPGEVVWPYCSACNGSGGPQGTGGGYSAIFARPSWQTVSGLLANGKRGYPDIAADADPNTGAYACYGTGFCAQFGGTSVGSPLWAGITALLNQYVTAQGKPALGFLAQTLYSLLAGIQPYTPYHDVTSGTNGTYNAAAGWDATTGNGSPDVWNLARDLAGTTTTATSTPTPTSTSGASAAPTNTPVPSTATPTSTPQPTATNTPVSQSGGTQQLIVNGGFESGTSPWQQSSSGGYQLVDPSNPHTGSHSAWLCGYTSCNDQIWQTVTVPSSVTQATLVYWLDVTTSSPGGCTNQMKVQLRTGSGTTISSLPTICNTATSGWVQETVDVTSTLSSYAGQSVQVYFDGVTGSTTTSFYVDDVALNVTTGTSSGSSPTNTPVPAATNTPVPAATNTPVPATATPTPTSTSGTTSSSCNGDQYQCYAFSLLNNDRAQYGVAPLKFSLTQSNGTSTCIGSYGHSLHLSQVGLTSVTAHDQFPADICLAYWTAGENVGEANYGNEMTDLQQLNSAMMNEGTPTPGCTGSHACNIINPAFTTVGVGIVHDALGNTWLTEDFVG